MEVSKQVYDWLQFIQCLDYPPLIEDSSVILHEEDTEAFEIGVKFKQVLKIFGKRLPTDDFSDLKHALDPASRLYNWNRLIPALNLVEIDIDPDKKALLVAGDRKTIGNILNLLCHKTGFSQGMPALQTKKKKRVNIDGAILINNIDITGDVKHTGSPLEFLILSLCKNFHLTPKQGAGLLTQSGKYLETLISRGLKGNFFPVLDWYRCILENIKHLAKLLMKDGESGALGLSMSALKTGLLSADISVYKASCLTLVALRSQLPELEGDIWEWVLAEEVIVPLIHTYSYSPNDLSESVSMFLYEFGRSRHIQLFGEMLWNYCTNPCHYFEIVSAVVSRLSLEGVHEFLTQGVVVDCLSTALRESEHSGDFAVRLGSLFLMCDLWEQFPAVLEEHEHLANSVLTEFKKAFSEKPKMFRLGGLGKFFQLLLALGKSTSGYIPILYKTLTFSLTEHFKVEMFREFVFVNLITIMDQIENLPLEILLEPTLKQMHAMKIHFNTFDFDFLLACARHRDLTLKLGVLLMDTLGKLYVNELRFARAAELPFLIVSGRFIDLAPAQEFITRFLGTAFKMLIHQHYPKRGVHSLGGPAEDPDTRALRTALLSFTEKLLKLGHPEMTVTLKELLSLVNTEAKMTIGQPLNGAVSLLDMVSKPNSPPATQLELEYIPDQESVVSRSKQYSVFTTTRAMSDIEKIAQQRKMKELHEQVILEEKEKAVAKQKEALQRQIQARRVELGVNPRKNADTSMVVPSKQRVDTNLLYDTNEETETDYDLLLHILKKYKRPGNALFKKYAKIGRKIERVTKEDFEAVRQNQGEVLEGQAIKMLRDLNITKDYISTEKLKQIFKQLIQRDGTTALSEDLFFNYLYQVSLHTFGKGTSRDLSHYPSAISLQALFECFARAEVIPSSLFNDPGCGTADKELIQELNEKLLQNPDLELPLGFKKVPDYIITLTYPVPETLQVPNSFRVALEIFDSILNEQFNLHILQPTIHVEEVYRAKGLLNKPEIVTETQRLGVPANKGAYKALPLPAYLSLTPAIKLTISKMVGQYPNELLLDIARLTDDLLHTVNSHSQNIISRNPKPSSQIDNAAKMQRNKQEAHLRAIQEQSEMKRKKRMEELKQELARLQVEKEQKLLADEKRLKNMEMKREKMMTYKNQVLEMARADKKKQLEEYRLQKEADKQKLLAEEEKHKGTANPDFLKKAKRKLRLLYKTKAEARKREQEEQEIKLKEAALKQTLREKSLQSKLAMAKKQHEAETSMKEVYNQAWEDPGVTKLVQMYAQSFQIVFETYSKQFLNPSSTDVSLMSFKAFNKFLTQFNIIPSLLNLESAERIYWGILKPKLNSMETTPGLSLSNFQQVCVRISLIASNTIQQDLDQTLGTTPDKFAGFLEWISLPVDSRETRDFLKKLDLHSVASNPREKKQRKNQLLRQLTNSSY